MSKEVLVYDAFSKIPNKGNPAGVVLDAEGLCESDMQLMAKKLGFNETAFVFVRGNEISIRYFTPGHEVPLCGHATIAAMTALYENDAISTGMWEINTGNGKIQIDVKDNEGIFIGMQQTLYKELPYRGDTAELAKVINLDENSFDSMFPIKYVNTGLWTLLVPVRKLSSFKDMKPRTSDFPKILTDIENSSIHPFCLETYDESCAMHGRHFSSPYSGTVEDAVTGTASGAMGVYYAKHVDPAAYGSSIKIEQGHEIGKEGIVEVSIPENLSAPVKIYGTAAWRKNVRC